MQAKKYTKETIVQYGFKDRGFPTFGVGDTISVIQRIQEGDKERLQAFQGDVIAIRHNGVSSMFTIRKIGAHGVPVERIFPFFSPLIKSIELLRHGQVRRAKLYYLRGRVGKRAKLKERLVTTHETAVTQ